MNRYITGRTALPCGCLCLWQVDRKDGSGTSALLRPACGKAGHRAEMNALIPPGSMEVPR
jgi:hypothetical protein